MSKMLDCDAVNEIFTREIDRVTRKWAERSAALSAVEEEYREAEALYLEYKDAEAEFPEGLEVRYLDLGTRYDAQVTLLNYAEEHLGKVAKMHGQFQQSIAFAERLLSGKKSQWLAHGLNE